MTHVTLCLFKCSALLNVFPHSEHLCRHPDSNEADSVVVLSVAFLIGIVLSSMANNCSGGCASSLALGFHCGWTDKPNEASIGNMGIEKPPG